MKQDIYTDFDFGKSISDSKPKDGFFGKYGGAFIPEMLYPNIEELENRYEEIIYSEEFKRDYISLAKQYTGRPTPLYYSGKLSERYKTNIYLKREDLCHTGAHKINNTIGQVLLAKALGKKRIIAETGAGQHGVATATICALFGIKCTVYMGEIDIERQKPNVSRMKMLGAEVVPAYSGSRTLKDATNEAIRDWIGNPTETYYVIGSVVGPHPYPEIVARLQSIISYETRQQFPELAKKQTPDYIISCVGGGSNAMGASYYFLNTAESQLIFAEAAGQGVNSGKSAATSILGRDGIIHGSKTKLMQTTDGQIVEAHSVSAGLDYPGIGPQAAHLIQTNRTKVFAITDEEALDAALELTRLEGIIPALESAHALAVLKKQGFTPQEHVVITLSGRGDKDLETYSTYFGF